MRICMGKTVIFLTLKNTEEYEKKLRACVSLFPERFLGRQFRRFLASLLYVPHKASSKIAARWTLLEVCLRLSLTDLSHLRGKERSCSQSKPITCVMPFQSASICERYKWSTNQKLCFIFPCASPLPVTRHSASLVSFTGRSLSYQRLGTLPLTKNCEQLKFQVICLVSLVPAMRKWKACFLRF